MAMARSNGFVFPFPAKSCIISCFKPKPIIWTEPELLPILIVGVVRTVKSVFLNIPIVSWMFGAGTYWITPLGILKVLIVLPLLSLISISGVDAFLLPPKVGAMVVVDDGSTCKWLDKPICVTLKLRSSVGTWATLAVIRRSKCKNFLVLAVLFQPLFKPVPKPLNNGSA